MSYPFVPVWRALVMDVTSVINDPAFLAQCGGAFYDVYVFDETYRVHIADTSPSRELWFVGGVPARVPEDEEEREKLLDEVLQLDASTPETAYCYCWGEARFSFPLQDVWPAWKGEVVTDLAGYEAQREEVFEFLRGNAGADHIVEHYLKRKEAK